jgi:hypothetical protein
MTLVHVPTLGRPPRRTTRQYGAVAAGIALVLLVAAGVVLWQVTRPASSSTAAPEAAVIAPAPAIAARDQLASTIYLVASPAQAQVVYADLEETNAVQVTSGEPMLASEVLWFDSIEAEVQFWSQMGAQQNRHVVDLRAPTAVSEATTPAAAVIVPAPAVTPRDQPAPTIYLVASQAQADATQRDIDDTNIFRAALGTAPLAASVLLFPSAEVESAFWWNMGEQALAAQGLPPVTVVDLRTPAARVPEPEPAAVSDQEMYQRAPPAPVAAGLRSVYLVDSEAAATAARQLAAGADQVLVVTTEEEASQVRVGFDQPGTAIIDLRSVN